MAEPTNKRRYSLFSKTLKSVLEPELRPVFKSQGIAASKLITEWPQIVGVELAKHCYPMKLNFPKDKNHSGTLIVACSGPHALTFQHMQPIIIERIASYFGYKAVARIMIEQRQMETPEKPKKATRAQPKKIDTSCVSEVTDEDLKQALSELAKTLTSPSI